MASTNLTTPPSRFKKASHGNTRKMCRSTFPSNSFDTQFTAESIKTALERESIGSEKTILGILRSSKDPETGEKLGFKELVTNANTLLYSYF
jgi:hypothetical protein